MKYNFDTSYLSYLIYTILSCLSLKSNYLVIFANITEQIFVDDYIEY